MTIKTVGELIARLQTFDPAMRVQAGWDMTIWDIVVVDRYDGPLCERRDGTVESMVLLDVTGDEGGEDYFWRPDAPD